MGVGHFMWRSKDNLWEWVLSIEVLRINTRFSGLVASALTH